MSRSKRNGSAKCAKSLANDSRKRIRSLQSLDSFAVVVEILGNIRNRGLAAAASPLLIGSAPNTKILVSGEVEPSSTADGGATESAYRLMAATASSEIEPAEPNAWFKHRAQCLNAHTNAALSDVYPSRFAGASA